MRVRVQGLVPITGAPGKAFRPQKVAVTATLPPRAVGDLKALGAASLTGSFDLQTRAHGQGAPRPLTWAGLKAPATVIGGNGALALRAVGEVPAVPGARSGVVSLVTDALRLTLTVRGADGRAPSPAAMGVACTPAQNQNTTIALVPIGEKPRRGAPPAGNAQALPTPNAPLCPYPYPSDVYNPDIPLPSYPQGSIITKAPDSGCALMNSYSTIKKLKGSARIIGQASVRAGLEQIENFDIPYPHYLQNRSTAVANFQPMETTFLAFGFMPVTATMELTQVAKRPGGNVNMHVVSRGAWQLNPQFPDHVLETEATGFVSARLRDVKVNGVPLAVGDRCRTARPIKLAVKGYSSRLPGYNITNGGWLDGQVEIPPFSGCGVTEDLDEVFTAAVSGPGNAVRVLQGPACFPAQAGQNPSLPCPSIEYGWTIKPGGKWKAVDPQLQVTSLTGALSLQCRAEIRGTLQSGRHLSYTEIGRLDSFTADCEDVSGDDFTIEFSDPQRLDLAVGSLPPSSIRFGNPTRKLALKFSGPGCAFVVNEFFDFGDFTFDTTTQMFSVAPLLWVDEAPGSDCGQKLSFEPGGFAWMNLTGAFGITPHQQITFP
nr:DUF6801 domain-containing protein [Thermomonospora umbrina]